MSDAPNTFSDENNPYRATNFDAGMGTPSVDGAEGIRMAHIQHEASIKSIGFLYMLGFLLCIIGIFPLGAGLIGLQGMGAQERGLMAGIGVFYILLGGFQGFTGYALRGLKPWARWTAVVFSAIGLIGFPIGTLISAYFLYLLLTEKATTIFSPEYQAIIQQTPHVKAKTSVLAWIILGILALGFVGLIVFVIFGTQV